MLARMNRPLLAASFVSSLLSFSSCSTVVAALAAKQASSSSSSSAASTSSGATKEYTGPVTFKNATTREVCEVQAPGAKPVRQKLAPGATVALPTEGRFDRVWVTACSEDALVAGTATTARAMFEALTAPTLALRDEGAAAADGEQGIPVGAEAFEAAYKEIASHLVKPWSPGTMAALAPESLSALRGYAAGRGYKEKYLSLELLSADWELNRDARTKALKYRWITGVAFAEFPVGKCLMYPVSFMQAAEGDGFSKTITSNGAGGGFEVPCSLARWAAKRPGVAN